MNQKKLLAASVAAACLAMTTSALAADYSNHTGTADGTKLAGHLNSTSVAINSTNDTFENNKLTFTATALPRLAPSRQLPASPHSIPPSR